MSSRAKHITVLVSNDLQHDQRVAKVCETLLGMGFRLSLVGRMLPDSKPMQRPYETRRFHLPFRTGALFYTVLQIRLFFYLLVKRTDIILANDLDTLLPAFIIARLRGKELVYDSHEYFTEAEGLTNRPFPKRVWLAVEGFIFPKLKHVFTVNETIAGIYRALYHVPVRVVRNIPMLQQPTQAADRKALGLADGEHVILLQGAFIDPDRGGLELVQSMQWVEQAVLFVIGTGRDLDAMKREVVRLNLESSVRFIPKLPYQELRAYTAIADVGVSLDKPLHLNYAYSLPNKVFDYIHAGVPLLVSDLPELRRLVETHNVGKIVRAVTPEEIAKALNEMLQSGERMQWRENALKAREVLNWQNESLVLREVYGQLV
jgi:glycosyltransferase involved in cell wall biosynthesis